MTPNEATGLEQKVLHFIRESKLIPPGSSLVVAVSGGPDSVCLLNVLVKLQKELDITLHAAHLNHQLRGVESDADAKYVSGLARRLGIPFTTEKQDVAAYRAAHRLSLEEAAREVRYSFLSRVAESVGAEMVVVGHTLDDNVETILMHLIRGSGTLGLRGLQSASYMQLGGRPMAIVRPLLQISRQETAAYCRQQGFKPRLDTTNLSLSPLRNQVRLRLLPQLRRYNRRIVEALLRTACIASDDLSFIDGEVAGLWGDVVREEGKTLVFDKKKFRELHPALKRHLLRASLKKLVGNLKDVESRHIEEILDALDKPAGRMLNLPYGLTFLIEYDRYLLGADPALLCPFPVLDGEYTLKLSGKTLLPGWRVTAAMVNREQVSEEADDFSVCLDLDKAGEEIIVRGARTGDRFQPLGLSRPKRLAEFMIDAKIPRAWRNRVPLVCSRGQILWVAGWRIDERVKVTDSTRRVLQLKMERYG